MLQTNALVLGEVAPDMASVPAPLTRSRTYGPNRSQNQFSAEVESHMGHAKGTCWPKGPVSEGEQSPTLQSNGHRPHLYARGTKPFLLDLVWSQVQFGRLLGSRRTRVYIDNPHGINSIKARFSQYAALSITQQPRAVEHGGILNHNQHIGS
jgi:hypothetical protein